MSTSKKSCTNCGEEIQNNNQKYCSLSCKTTESYSSPNYRVGDMVKITSLRGNHEAKIIDFKYDDKANGWIYEVRTLENQESHLVPESLLK